MLLGKNMTLLRRKKALNCRIVRANNTILLKTVQYVAAVTAAGIFTAASARGDADKYQPDIPQALVTEVNEARELYEKRDLETAERLLRDVISKNDDYYRAHYNLGLILQAEGKPDDAVTELKKALALQQKFPKIHDNSIFLDLGRAYYDGGDYTQAEAQYIKGLERKTENDPDTNKRLLVNLGNLYFQSGDLDKAKSTLEQATDEFPNSGANELRETVDEYSRRKSSEREVSTREPVKEGWVYYGLRKEGIPSAKDGT